MEKNFDYDLIVLGAGPAGYVGAIRASQLGLKVLVLEKEKLGGVCLNVGCIPSKALIHLAENFYSLKEWEKMGLSIGYENFDYGKVYAKSRQAADRLAKGVEFLLKKNKVEVVSEEGKIVNPNTIETSAGKKFTAKNILIATGSKPKTLPGFSFDEKDILSSTGALLLQKLPKSLLILGAGAIGIEFAHIMNAFGVDVHIVEALDQILPLEDEEVVEVLGKLFKRRKIKISTGTKALSCERKDGILEVTLEKKDGTRSAVQAEKVLVAIGRTPNTENIGLENIGISCDRGFIQVGDYYQTKVPGVYAAGDIVPMPLLAHVASKEAEIAVEHIAGKTPEKKISWQSIPSAVYCEPQIGSFGYTEKRAKAEGIPYSKATFPYRGVGKAVATENSEGLVKVLFDPKTKEILGAHIVGAEATELLHEILLAKTSELLPMDIAQMIHAHPTLSEGVMEAMRSVEGWAIHA
ncbi:MAG: dihydrolipoyl dehydrogenase [Candidatus Brocadiae bacterium]|nr:dihydrolipoyl dehydrogenase [Candidatus Brocadiia bacterium]